MGDGEIEGGRIGAACGVGTGAIGVGGVTREAELGGEVGEVIGVV
jgi:hypothetical protein